MDIKVYAYENKINILYVYIKILEVGILITYFNSGRSVYFVAGQLTC